MVEETQTVDNVLDTPEVPTDGQDEQQQAENYGDWNEHLPEQLISTLMKLDQHFADEFKLSRRLQCMQSWKARSFWRELQHISWNWSSQCFDLMGANGVLPDKTGSGECTKNSAVMYSTNMFQGFGDAFIAIMTQGVPSLRFEPDDVTDPADVETAHSADDIRQILQHENDPIKLSTKAAYYMWTDGFIAGWTRWDKDPFSGQMREMQNVYGALEVKVPTICDDGDQMLYLQFSKEYHLSQARAKVRSRDFDGDYWKKIKGGPNGNGQDVYERDARISIKQGLSYRAVGGDLYAALVTTRRSWMQTEAFYEECVPEGDRDQLVALFPDGCYLESDSGVYTGSQQRRQEDEWSIGQAMEGDGCYRPAKGTCLISVQERFNDLINITQDTYEKCIPASHWDDQLFDVDAFKRQLSTPGERHPVHLKNNMPPGDGLSNHVMWEQPAVVGNDMLTFMKELMSDVPEFLTGLSAVLFGADSGDKSGKALGIQQAAAKGRIGLQFRNLARWYARMMEQGVHCFCKNRPRTQDVTMGVPDNQGRVQSIQVRIESMNGQIRCYPDSDENWPDTPTQKKSTFMQLMMDAKADPIINELLTDPQNQMIARNLMGLDSFEVPDADSWQKQKSEINMLLQEPVSLQDAPPTLDPLSGQLVQPPPIEESSIPVDPIYDNHQIEFETVQRWINSQEGQITKKENPEGFKNVQLHGEEHQKIMQQQAMQAAMMAQATNPGNNKSKPVGEASQPRQTHGEATAQ